MPSITTINKTNVSSNVFEQLLDMIVSGQWKIGCKIPSENELKNLLGVSRNTLRAGISRLSALGMLESRQGEGTYVKKLDLTFYLNIFIPSMLLEAHDTVSLLEFERGLQIESARLASTRRSEEQLRQLFAFIDRMEEFIFTDPELYLKNDLNFHLLICEMSCNDLLLELMKLLRVLIYYSLRQIVKYFDCTISIKFHRSIAEAIQKKDQESATQLMAEHFNDVINKQCTILSVNDSGGSNVESWHPSSLLT